MTFTAAILGRPNVGKSTLFNRLVGRRLALVHGTPGVTRDRREGKARLDEFTFKFVDTAGLGEAAPGSLEARMQAQTERALEEADVALLLIDARAGATPVDRHFADWVRKASTPVILVANKCEGRAAESGLYEAYSLGLGEPVAISAEHGEGMAELYEALKRFAEEAQASEPAADLGQDQRPRDETAQPLGLAIVGRPNVGKSTLANRLLGEDRLLTGPEAGITRDAVSVDWSYGGRPVRLVDTAGLRRKARISDKLETLSVRDAGRAIERAEVVVLVMDAREMLEKQDLTIARTTNEKGRALVIAANKWDLVKDPEAMLARLKDRLEASFSQAKGVPWVTVSALTGRNLDKLMEAVFQAHDLWNRRVSTGRLNRWLARVVEHHPPPLVQGRRLKLRYVTQVEARPPTFALFVNKPEKLPESYVRYLVNTLREDFGLPGVPIRMLLRKGRNPYARAPAR